MWWSSFHMRSFGTKVAIRGNQWPVGRPAACTAHGMSCWYKMHQWLNWMIEWELERAIEWMNEWMTDWLNEWMNEWVSEWGSEWMNEWNEWLNEWMNEMNDWMNECVNGIMNGTMNEWNNDSMTERANERTNKSMKWNGMNEWSYFSNQKKTPTIKKIWFHMECVLFHWTFETPLSSNPPSLDVVPFQCMPI